MLKGFKFRGVDGGWLHIEETEDLQSIKVCVDHGDAQTSVWLDREAFNDLTELRHKIDVNYPEEKGSEEYENHTVRGTKRKEAEGH